MGLILIHVELLFIHSADHGKPTGILWGQILLFPEKAVDISQNTVYILQQLIDRFSNRSGSASALLRQCLNRPGGYIG